MMAHVRRCEQSSGMQVGFLVRIEGQRLTADVAECLPDYEFAFEGADEGVPGMYYRCNRTRDLQAHFGDMLHRIHDLEVKALKPGTWRRLLIMIELFIAECPGGRALYCSHAQHL